MSCLIAYMQAVCSASHVKNTVVYAIITSDFYPYKNAPYITAEQETSHRPLTDMKHEKEKRKRI
jgi:hypothetical protein